MLATAFDRIDDFIAVQHAAGGPTLEAVELLQLAAGIGDLERAEIARRADMLGAPGGAVLLGVLVGLLAADGLDQRTNSRTIP
jgi:hypothetical protein